MHGICQQTLIAKGIEESVELFKAFKYLDATGNLLVIFSDGEDTSSLLPFEEVLEANIKGVFHIYEGARRHGVQRVVFASSNHVMGYYKQNEVVDALSPPRPDGFYGLSKAFGEDLSRLYFDRDGIEIVGPVPIVG